MVRKRLTKCAAVYVSAAVFLLCHWAQTEGSRLIKSERKDGRKEATEKLQEGVIVFGKSQTGSDNVQSQLNVADDVAYQADSPGWAKGRVAAKSKEALWKRMSPSLLCGEDQMKFRAVGPSAKLLSLDQEPPLPLSHVPFNCGYDIQRNPFGLVMHVPYDGCNMVQEDGNYVLPMRWQGMPVTLRCPKPIDPPTTPVPQDPVFPGPFYPHHWQHSWHPVHYKPTETPTVPAPQDLVFPGPFYPHHWQHPWRPVQYKPTKSPTVPAPQDPVPLGPFYPHYWQHPWRPVHYKPEPPTVPAPQDPVSPGPFYPHHWQHPWRPVLYKPTEPPTVPAPQDLVAAVPFHPHHWQHPWHPVLHKPKEPASTTLPEDPMPHGYLYPHPWYPVHYKPKEPASTSAPVEPLPHRCLYPHHWHHPWCPIHHKFEAPASAP